MVQNPRYTIIIEPADEGGYVVYIPALNGSATQGDTWDEAIYMARDLIQGYLEVTKKSGRTVPTDTKILSVTTTERTFTYNDFDD